MAKIYNPPKSWKEPVWDVRATREQNQQAEQDAIEALRKMVQDKSDPLSGKIVQMHVADGFALYMVHKSKPLSLIHIPIGDAYEYPFMNRLRLSDVRKLLKEDAS